MVPFDAKKQRGGVKILCPCPFNGEVFQVTWRREDMEAFKIQTSHGVQTVTKHLGKFRNTQVMQVSKKRKLKNTKSLPLINVGDDVLPVYTQISF